MKEILVHKTNGKPPRKMEEVDYCPCGAEMNEYEQEIGVCEKCL